jgi:hypothetical protein
MKYHGSKGHAVVTELTVLAKRGSRQDGSPTKVSIATSEKPNDVMEMTCRQDHKGDPLPSWVYVIRGTDMHTMPKHTNLIQHATIWGGEPVDAAGMIDFAYDQKSGAIYIQSLVPASGHYKPGLASTVITLNWIVATLPLNVKEAMRKPYMSFKCSGGEMRLLTPEVVTAWRQFETKAASMKDNNKRLEFYGIMMNFFCTDKDDKDATTEPLKHTIVYTSNEDKLTMHRYHYVLPQGWNEARAESGRKYYWNDKGHSQWKRPTG